MTVEQVNLVYRDVKTVSKTVKAAKPTERHPLQQQSKQVVTTKSKASRESHPLTTGFVDPLSAFAVKEASPDELDSTSTK